MLLFLFFMIFNVCYFKAFHLFFHFKPFFFPKTQNAHSSSVHIYNIHSKRLKSSEQMLCWTKYLMALNWNIISESFSNLLASLGITANRYIMQLMLCALHIMLEQLFSSASDPSTVMGLQSAVNQNLLLQDDWFYHVPCSSTDSCRYGFFNSNDD